MKRISVLTILPLLLFALEKVNLVKDHSFEKDSEVWHTRVGGGWPQIALVSRHDPESAYTGEYSGSGDTRPEPENPPLSFVQSAYVIQGFSSPKKTVEDIDSLTLFYSARYLYDDVDRSFLAYILLHLNANSEDFMKVGYILKRPGEPIGTQPHYAIFKSTSFTQDTLWHTLSEGISTDIRSWGSIPLNAVVDSFILWVTGFNLPPWRGQKVFFDDVRLMGFADYDVGVKEITSVTETIPYTPAALIKNFGREPAEFSVVAEILQGETQVYHDSIDWSLPADTEDTVSFKSFTPPDTGAYLLRIYTVMEPDESDADDEQTKELHFEAIAEPVTHPQLLTLEVKSSLTTPLQVSYSLPKGHTGALTLFDLSGRRVDAKQVRGYGSASFNTEVAAGVYIVRLEAGGTTLSRKVVVVR